MKKVRIAAFAGAATLALAVPAVAQTPPLDVQVEGSVKAAKGKAATKKKPKKATVRHAFTVNAESRKTASVLTLFFPETIKLSGKGFPSCDVDTALAVQCPKGSQVGSGTATAVLSGPTADEINFTTKVYANGADGITLYLDATELQFQTAFPGEINKATKPYGQSVTVTIPTAVQQPAPGLFAYITGVDTTIKGTRVKGKGKKKKTSSIAALTGCPADKTHDFGVQITYVQNDAGPGGTSSVFNGESPCRK